MTPKLIRALAVFVPPVAPLETEILATNDTVEKVLAASKPMLDRVEAGQPAFLEAFKEEPAIVAMLPQIIMALKTYAKIGAIAEDYASRVDKAVG